MPVLEAVRTSLDRYISNSGRYCVSPNQYTITPEIFRAGLPLDPHEVHKDDNIARLLYSKSPEGFKIQKKLLHGMTAGSIAAIKALRTYQSFMFLPTPIGYPRPDVNHVSLAFKKPFHEGDEMEVKAYPQSTSEFEIQLFKNSEEKPAVKGKIDVGEREINIDESYLKRDRLGNHLENPVNRGNSNHWPTYERLSEQHISKGNYFVMDVSLPKRGYTCNGVPSELKRGIESLQAPWFISGILGNDFPGITTLFVDFDAKIYGSDHPGLMGKLYSWEQYGARTTAEIEVKSVTPNERFAPFDFVVLSFYIWSTKKNSKSVAKILEGEATVLFSPIKQREALELIAKKGQIN